jgi:hypothetical protein
MGARVRHERADKTEAAHQSLTLSGLDRAEGVDVQRRIFKMIDRVPSAYPAKTSRRSAGLFLLCQGRFARSDVWWSD